VISKPYLSTSALHVRAASAASSIRAACAVIVLSAGVAGLGA
jgi:hypothetical protein